MMFPSISEAWNLMLSKRRLFQLGFLIALPPTAYFWYRTYRQFRTHADDEPISWVNDQAQQISEVIDITGDSNKLETLNQQLSDASAEGYKIVRMKVPSRAVGAVIGKQGCVIKRIQSATKTTIHFVDRPSVCLEPQMGNTLLAANNYQSSTADGNTGTSQGENQAPASLDYEVISIKGLSQRVLVAAQEIQRIIDSVPIVCEAKITVDNKYIGFIIGKKGINIRRIKEESGARIDVDQSSSSNIRVITLRGAKEQVENAKQFIDEVIKDADRRDNSFGNQYSRPVAKVNGDFRRPNDSDLSQSEVNPSNSIHKQLTLNGHSEQKPQISECASLNGEPSSLPLPPYEVFPQTTSQVEIYVSCVVNCQQFCIKLTSPSIGTQGLEQLVGELTDYYAEQSNVPSRALCKGDFVAALCSLGNTWQRATVHSVQEVNGEIMVDLDYCDFGDCEQLPYEKVRLFSELPEPLYSKVWSTPLQAIPAKLKGIRSREPNGEWSEDAIGYFESIAGVTDSRPIKAFWSGQGNNQEVLVQLLDESVTFPRKSDLAAELVRMGYAAWD